LGEIAKLTGSFTVAGVEIDGNLQKTAELVNKGFDALKFSSSGDLKVDISNIGIDFASGAEGLQGNVEDGIKAIAQS